LANTLDITEELISITKRFLSTPREFKHFANSLRFYYIMESIRISQCLPTPSLDQLGYFTLLSIKWPESIRWLRLTTISEKYTEQGYGIERNHHEISSNSSLSNLLILEKIGEMCVNAKKQWQDEVKFILELEPHTNIWMNDEHFAGFFKLQGSLPKENRLSSATAKGLF
jgi:hypothetical protein